MKLRMIILGLAGPAIALCATWYEGVKIARVKADDSITLESVERLREIPTDAALAEMNKIALGVTTFDEMESEVILANADETFEGQFDYYGEVKSIQIPFQPSDDLLGRTTWHLRLNSFIVPGLLARAYELSGDAKYLLAAVDYIIDWERFESALLVARDPVFNDHAIAARAVVATNIWRLYRRSNQFSADKAIQLVEYVSKLSRLLRNDRLYQYTSNHGLMQNLALLHVAVAFPLLEETDRNIAVGKNRLLSQLRYYMNMEGVILEHSTGYHHLFLTGLSAAWRYLALLDISVPPELAQRYERAIRFNANMIRPDGTLPPIGDTRDEPYGTVWIAPLDDDLLASPLIPFPVGEASRPDPALVAPAAGYAVFWRGLEHWPNVIGLSQTALAWAKFPGGSHKHADELSIAIWAGGIQWVRGIGYWPYVSSRKEALGWRSSNAPHWSGESASDDRNSFLTGTVEDKSLTFLDIVRRNTTGNSVRRQIVILDEGTWIILDDFDSRSASEVELIWRFSPELALEQIEPGAFVISTGHAKQAMTVQFELPAGSKVQADFNGRAEWNHGVISGYDIVEAPAIRVISEARHPVLNTVFRLHEDVVSNATGQGADLDWQRPEQWKLVLDGGGARELVIRRRGDRLNFAGPGKSALDYEIIAADLDEVEAGRRDAIDAFEEASKRYGRPFGPAIERRSKISLAIVVGTFVQMLFFFTIPARLRTWRPAIGTITFLGWIALSLFIGMHYVV